jgi:tripeptidyl-peptidase-1
MWSAVPDRWTAWGYNTVPGLAIAEGTPPGDIKTVICPALSLSQQQQQQPRTVHAMRLSILLSLLPAIALALPTAPPADYSAYTLFESHPAPEGWHQLSTLPSPSTPITLRFHLQTSHADLERELLTVSDPTSPRYGDHLSRETLFALTAPVDGAVEVVGDWLRDTTDDVTVDGDVIKVRLTLAEAEELLHTKYSAFQNDEDGKTLVRTLSYSVPEAVKPFVATVQPTNMFTLRNLRSNIIPLDRSAAMNYKMSIDIEPSSSESKSEFSVESVTESAEEQETSCNSTVTLACLANLYGFVDYEASGETDIGISGFLEQYAQYSDLEIFLEKYKPEAVGANFSVVSVNGGANLQNVTGTDNISEANLDIQYALGISHPANNTYYTTAGRPPFVPDLVSFRVVVDEN